MKHLLLTASVLALFNSSSFATWQEDLQNQVFLEVGKSKIIQKLMKSQDYTIDLDEGDLVNTITKIVKDKNKGKGISGEKLKSEDIRFETHHQILNTLDWLKTAHVPIGYGYYTTQNFRGNALCLETAHNPLVYAIKSFDREHPDGFLPVTYKSNFMSQKLCDEIDYYASNNGLSKDEAKRLNRYLQPIFYIVQQEVSQMLDGKKSLLHTQRWVYGKDYSGIVKSVKEQTEHHHALISKAGLKGFNPSVVETKVVPSLVDLALSLMSNPNKEIYRSGGKGYTLGLNHNGHLSLLHPSIEDLPYPVFSEHRGRGNMNLPKGFEDSSALRKQWNRVGEFVRLNERISSGEKTRSIILLEPVGYLFNKNLKTFHVAKSDYPVQREAENRIIELARMFADTHTIFPPFLDMFYNGNVNIHEVLADIRYKSDYHLALTDDLWPQRLSNQKERLTDDLLNYLVFKDIIDRFDEFYRYNGSRLDGMKTALNM